MRQICSPGFPYPYPGALSRVTFPQESLALSADVSPQTIHFQVLDKSSVSGPGRYPLSCHNWIFFPLLPAQSHPSRLPQSTKRSSPQLPTSHFLPSSLNYYYYSHVLLQSHHPYPFCLPSHSCSIFSLSQGTDLYFLKFYITRIICILYIVVNYSHHALP